MSPELRSSPLTPAQLRKAAVIAAVASPVLGALCRTLRWTTDGGAHLDALTRREQSPILAFWHGRIFGGTAFFRDRAIVVITSQNFDGEWIAGIIRRFGFGTARGSSSRGGARALVQLRRVVFRGAPAAVPLIRACGPPPRVPGGGVFLAASTRHPRPPSHNTP